MTIDHNQELARLRAMLEANLGPDQREIDRLSKIKTKPASAGNWWFKPVADVVRSHFRPGQNGQLPTGRPCPSATLPRRSSKMDRNERAKFARLVEILNRTGRKRGASGRMDQGPIKASGVEIIKSMVFDHYNPETGRLDPSSETIARDTGWSVRTVQRARDRLRASGLLSWFRRSKWTNAGWRPTSNRYVIGQLGAETTGRNIKEYGRKEAAAILQPVRDLAAAICPKLYLVVA